MKQLTKEQQEEMLKMIEHLSKEDAFINRDYYIDKAKAFLQSLKPKVYVCIIHNNGKINFWKDDYFETGSWSTRIEDAKVLELQEAHEVKDRFINDNQNIFILTE